MSDVAFIASLRAAETHAVDWIATKRKTLGLIA